MKIADAKLAKPEVIDTYAKIASLYDLWGGLTETHARRKALALAQIQDGETVLEVAVGTGLTFWEILKANPNGENTGIDLTPAMLDKAIRKAAQSGQHNYTLQTGDAYHLDFPGQHFDLLMNNFMFDLLPEQDFPKVLAEFKRVLKPSGRIVLVNMTRSEHWYEQIWERVYRFNPRWLGGCRGVLLHESLQAAGFNNIHRETVSQLGFPEEIITAKLAQE